MNFVCGRLIFLGVQVCVLVSISFETHADNSAPHNIGIFEDVKDVLCIWVHIGAMKFRLGGTSGVQFCKLKTAQVAPHPITYNLFIIFRVVQRLRLLQSNVFC